MKLLREYIQELLTEETAPSYESSEYDDKLRKAFLNNAKQGAELAKSVGAGIAEPMQEVIDKIHQAFALRFDLQDKQVQEQDIDDIPDPWLRPNLWWNPRQEKIDELLREAEDSFDRVFPPRVALPVQGQTRDQSIEMAKLAYDFRRTTFVGGNLPGAWIVLAVGKNSRTRSRGRIHWLSEGIIKRFENLAEWAGIQV